MQVLVLPAGRRVAARRVHMPPLLLLVRGWALLAWALLPQVRVQMRRLVQLAPLRGRELGLVHGRGQLLQARGRQRVQMEPARVPEQVHRGLVLVRARLRPV